MTCCQLELRSRLADIDRATTLVADFADRARLDARTRVALTLVLEELVSNTVTHGGGDPQASIRVQLQLQGDRIVLRYEDGGRPFDPTRALPADDRDQPLAERGVGGLGWPLIHAYCGQPSYRRVGERNCLELTLPATGPGVRPAGC